MSNEERAQYIGSFQGQSAWKWGTKVIGDNACKAYVLRDEAENTPKAGE